MTSEYDLFLSIKLINKNVKHIGNVFGIEIIEENKQ